MIAGILWIVVVVLILYISDLKSTDKIFKKKVDEYALKYCQYSKKELREAQEKMMDEYIKIWNEEVDEWNAKNPDKKIIYWEGYGKSNLFRNFDKADYIIAAKHMEFMAKFRAINNLRNDYYKDDA